LLIAFSSESAMITAIEKPMTDTIQPRGTAVKKQPGGEGALVRFGLALAHWSERWFPDPLIFAFIVIIFVFVTD